MKKILLVRAKNAGEHGELKRSLDAAGSEEVLVNG